MRLRQRMQRKVGTVLCIDAEEGQIRWIVKVHHRGEKQA